MLYLKSLSPRLIKNRFLLLKSYLRRESVTKGFPVELSIEVTNHCNADCIMCPREKMTREKGFMDFALFKKIVDEAKDYAELAVLHFAGEPLLHPELIRMIDYCGKIGLRTMFSTNAILLDSDKSKALIGSPLDLLILSFDGVNKETYEKIRRKSNFENTYRNIQGFLQLKSKSKRAPYTIIQLVYQEENFNEAKDFVLRWKDSEIDAVRIKPYLNYPGLDKYLGKIPKVNSAYLAPCILLWRQLAIYWDGTVVPCCMDFLSGMVVGNINRESIKDVWNGERLVKMRQAHIQGVSRQLPLCKYCTVSQLNLPLLLGMVCFDDLAIKKILPKIEQLVILKDIHRISYFS